MEEWKWEVWQGASESKSKVPTDERVSDGITNETSLDSPVTVNGTILPVTEGAPTMTPPERTPVLDRMDHPPPVSDKQVGQGHMSPTQEVMVQSIPGPKSVIIDPTTTNEVSFTLVPETVTPLVTVSAPSYGLIFNNTIQEARTETNGSFALENASIVAVPDPSQSMSLASIHSMQTLLPLSSPSSVSSGESIYRTIMNRLAMLETNTTLYQKYVEEQTLQVREALRRLEEEVGRLEGLVSNILRQQFLQ